MGWRRSSYFFLSAVPPVAAIALAFFFASHEFLLAWLSGLLIVICAEGRVQVGERLSRSRTLWVHLSFAVPFFALLSILAFWASTLPIEIATAFLGVGAFVTGAMLWHRGLSARMIHFIV